MHRSTRWASVLVQAAWLCAALLTPTAAVHAADSATPKGYEVERWRSTAPMPDLLGVDLAGKEWRLSELRGKVVVLNFWATWCEPCREEMPSLQALAQRYPDTVVVLAINLKESPEQVQRYAQISGIALPLLLDPQGSTTWQWGVRIYPSTVLIDRKGQPRQRIRGALDWTLPEATGWVDKILRR
jgi:thiol-disulfide isomerase/thioredoxin